MGYDMRWHQRDPEEITRTQAAREQLSAASRELRELPREEKGTMKREVVEANGFDWDDPAAWEGQSERYTEVAARVKKASQDYEDSDVSYFRLNIHGMSVMSRIMGDLGLLFDAGRYPDWPKVEDFGITWDDVECYNESYVIPVEGSGIQMTKDMISREKFNQAKAFAEARNAVLSWYGDEPPFAIAYHKFCSNDGWIVTPEEIRAALSNWAHNLEEIRSHGAEEDLYEAFDKMGISKGFWMSWIAYLNGAAEHGGFEVH